VYFLSAPYIYTVGTDELPNEVAVEVITRGSEGIFGGEIE